jgi:hypothetical protein
VTDSNKPHTGFVSLKSITQGAPDPAAALSEIRRIYFKTTRETIEHDFAHAIELIKALPDETWRSKAHVFMEGLAEMRTDWMRSGKSGTSEGGKLRKVKPSKKSKKSNQPEPSKRSKKPPSSPE